MADDKSIEALSKMDNPSYVEVECIFRGRGFRSFTYEDWSRSSIILPTAGGTWAHINGYQRASLASMLKCLATSIITLIFGYLANLGRNPWNDDVSLARWAALKFEFPFSNPNFKSLNNVIPIFRPEVYANLWIRLWYSHFPVNLMPQQATSLLTTPFSILFKFNWKCTWKFRRFSMRENTM